MQYMYWIKQVHSIQKNKICKIYIYITGTWRHDQYMNIVLIPAAIKPHQVRVKWRHNVSSLEILKSDSGTHNHTLLTWLHHLDQDVRLWVGDLYREHAIWNIKIMQSYKQDRKS